MSDWFAALHSALHRTLDCGSGSWSFSLKEGHAVAGGGLAYVEATNFFGVDYSLCVNYYSSSGRYEVSAHCGAVGLVVSVSDPNHIVWGVCRNDFIQIADLGNSSGHSPQETK